MLSDLWEKVGDQGYPDVRGRSLHASFPMVMHGNGRVCCRLCMNEKENGMVNEGRIKRIAIRFCVSACGQETSASV
jgi:hypothetical protein